MNKRIEIERNRGMRHTRKREMNGGNNLVSIETEGHWENDNKNNLLAPKFSVK